MNQARSTPRTQTFVLAGGQGERLFPLTASRPKPAIPFGGFSRIIDYTLSNCLNSKLSQVALLTQYRHDELRAYVHQRWSESWNSFGNGANQLVCLPPTCGKRYRGTADAVFQNLSVIQSNRAEYVVILSGDHVYEMDYRELLARHIETNADVTLATIEHPLKDASHFGVVEVDNDFRVTGFQEKPLQPRALPSRPDRALISMGVYVFNAALLVQTLMENCESAFGYDFGHHVVPSLIGAARVYAFDFRDDARDAPRYWRDIGTIDSYYDASMDVARGKAPLNSLSLPESRASISASSRVSESVLSAGVRVEQDASVVDSVLLPGVFVGRGARLRHAIIEEGVQIPAGFRAGWDFEHDRKHHTVSRNGVVVISKTSKMTRPVFTHFGNDHAARGRFARTIA